MPEIIETTVYRLGELSEAARENARAWGATACSKTIGMKPSSRISRGSAPFSALS